MFADQLKTAAARLGAEQASLGLYRDNARPQVWHYPASPGPGDTDSYPLLCTVKLFTASLLALLSAQYGFALSDRIAELARRFGLPQLLPCAELSLSHLLAHCHGLAESELAQESEASWQQIATAQLKITRLFAPGHFYSYGSLGYRLLGSFMEHLAQAPFGHLLDTQLLAALAGTETRGAPAWGGSPAVCPAAGTGLELSLESLLAFCSLFTDPGRSLPDFTPTLRAELLQPRIAMPGWTPYLRASCYGFRDFGQGWFGHNGVDGAHLSYVRINPASKAAVCLVARGNQGNIGALPALLLQAAYPELVLPAGRQPKVLPDKHLGPGHPLLGCYSDARRSYRCLLDAGSLKLQVFETTEARRLWQVAHECLLYPAENELYFLARPWKKTACVQWLAGGDGVPAYLWDQDQVLPKVAGMQVGRVCTSCE
jgi:hypothetical protein